MMGYLLINEPLTDGSKIVNIELRIRNRTKDTG